MEMNKTDTPSSGIEPERSSPVRNSNSNKMHVTLKFSVVIIFITAFLQGIKAESEDVQEVFNQTFIVDDNIDRRELVKAELHKLFDDLLEAVNQKLERMESKIELSLSKLTESLHEKQMTMISNLSESWNQKEVVRDSRSEKLIENLSASITDKLSQTETKMENSLAKISWLFLKNLTTIDSGITSTMMNMSSSVSESSSKLAPIIERNQQQLSHSFANLSETIHPSESGRESVLPLAVNNQTGISTSLRLPPSKTVVEEIEGDLGTIEFDGRGKSDVKRKLWIFRATGWEYLNVDFVLEENGLGTEAQLLLWEVGHEQHEYTGAQTDWSTPKRFKAVAFLVVMLNIGNSSTQPPSFKLRFHLTRVGSNYFKMSDLLTKDGLQSFSYPKQNNENYSQGSDFYAVVAPSSATPFQLTLKYMDIPGTPPKCANGHLALWFIVESPTETKVVEQSNSSFSGCGRLGNISELIGHTTVAVLRFYSSGETGRGFRLEIGNSG